MTELPSSFAGLLSLQRLWLEDNQLSAFPPQLFNLTKLKVLRLSNNAIPVISSKIARLTDLEDLVSRGRGKQREGKQKDRGGMATL